jgi:hypothetical protein
LHICFNFSVFSILLNKKKKFLLKVTKIIYSLFVKYNTETMKIKYNI